MPTREAYAQKVSSWQGRDVNELLSSWGVPSQTLQMPNGNTLHTYISQFTQQSPLQQNSFYEPGGRMVINDKDGQSRTVDLPGRWVNNGFMGGGTMHLSCRTNFVINAQTQLVESVSFDGNNCVATPRNN
ncbi:hypothetical protein HZU77_005260 [Neisseriaceae bacterium TC5R-5]|nr:hypothetical protein [Neisseriaceae bacterium TC5R-5]